MEISGKILHSTLTQFYLIPTLFFQALLLFCCLALDLSTIFSCAPLLPALAEATVAVVLTRAPSQMVGQKKEEETGEKEVGNERERPRKGTVGPPLLGAFRLPKGATLGTKFSFGK